MNVFRSNVSRLKSSVSNMKIKNNTDTFSKTNITPFTKDLEQVTEAIELLNRYKLILENDIDTLERTGNELQAMDSDLANYRNNISGPQPIR
ncbi:TIGR04197 family type VII secretion effector [Paraliobacillus sp. JSM ZJ581]|uniref:TIGR04197 family type VII secretion effector n=1 Tax=Paraliobacillus sp. JSM ZJ581 TaxID=3342118 RepID=UPI0035A8F1A4